MAKVKYKKKVFSKKIQTKIGQRGEEAFLSFYGKENWVKTVKQNDPKDFINIKTGESCEQKSDQYFYPEDTENLVMERYANDNTMNPGGPWKSLYHKIDYFCYYFANSKICFWFKVKELVKFLDKFIIGEKAKKIWNKNWNKNWNTIIYLVPFKELENLVIRTDKF